MINVCRKGKVVECYLANWLKEHGFAGARRSEQHNGAEGLADIVAPGSLDEWHIESKGTKKALLARSQLKSWVEQIDRDCPENQKAVILNVANRKDIIALIPDSVFKIIWTDGWNGKSFNYRIFSGESFSPTKELTEMYTNDEVISKTFQYNRPSANFVMFGPFESKTEVLVAMWGEVWITLLRQGCSYGSCKFDKVPESSLPLVPSTLSGQCISDTLRAEPLSPLPRETQSPSLSEDQKSVAPHKPLCRS